MIIQHVSRGICHKFDLPAVLKEIADGWIEGKSFGSLMEIIRNRNAKMICGSQKREFNIDHVVDICEGVLAFEGTLVVSAVCEFVQNIDHVGTKALVNRLQLLQKRLKYGLPNKTTIALYELGFSDRVIAQDLAASLGLVADRKKNLVKELKKDRKGVEEVMDKYPSYFQKRIDDL